MDENIRIYFGNIRLRKSLEELKRLNKWWIGCGSVNEEKGDDAVFKSSEGYRN
jgi:hypothetical protein